MQVKCRTYVTAQVVDPSQQPQEHVTFEGGSLDVHYPDSSQATSEAGRLSQEFVEDPEFRAHPTDALAGARHLHSIGHRHIFYYCV